MILFERFGLIDHWLQPVRDVVDRHFECRECGAWSNEDLDRLCETSVAEQTQRLARTPTLQAAWQAGKDVSIHGWVYGLKDGLLTDLQCTLRRK